MTRIGINGFGRIGRLVVRARRDRLSHRVSEGLAALLATRRDEIRHPDPSLAGAFGMTLVFSTLDSTMLFGEMRSGAAVLSDDALAEELSRAFLAYLGVAPDAD